MKAGLRTHKAFGQHCIFLKMLGVGWPWGEGGSGAAGGDVGRGTVGRAGLYERGRDIGNGGRN